MSLNVLYFASLREAVGRSAEQIELPRDVETAGALRQWLCQRGEPWQAALGSGRAVRVAVDQRMASADTSLASATEVAFFPPVTGG